ncbi:MAG TPA: redoxin family protein [Bacteroidota bacterium]|nr:redoxin family protein [Bacteroidota bacterium]
MKRLLHLLLLGLLMNAKPMFADEYPTLPLGSPAPEFNLSGIDGRTYSLKDFAGAKILIVAFTCNHCPTAQYYEGRIKQIVSDYKEKGVELVAIMPNDPKSVRLDELGWSDMGDSFAEMKIRWRDRQFNFPYLYDGETEATSHAYGPVATPHVFVFDEGRKLRYVGAIDNSERIEHVTIHYLRDALDSLLAGKEPPVTQTKAVGCSIKWSGKEELVKQYLEKLDDEPVEITKADTSALAGLKKNGSGKFRLINFWATWCAPCLAEFEDFVTVNRMYRHRDFELVTVSINRPDEEKQVLEFLKKKHASSRNLLFASADRDKLMDSFDPKWQGAVPYTLLLDPEGNVVYREVGSVDFLAVKRALLKGLNERKPW